jgi:hypothetical protein
METGIAPIKQALVATLRDITDLKSAVGSEGFHEGTAIHGTPMPYILHSLIYSRRDYATFGGGPMIKATFDIEVVHPNSVEAGNLDLLILQGLTEEAFAANLEDTGSGQTTLLCRRVLDLSSDDVSDEGKKLYRIGGSYEIWTDQTA